MLWVCFTFSFIFGIWDKRGFSLFQPVSYQQDIQTVCVTHMSWKYPLPWKYLTSYIQKYIDQNTGRLAYTLMKFMSDKNFNKSPKMKSKDFISRIQLTPPLHHKSPAVMETHFRNTVKGAVLYISLLSSLTGYLFYDCLHFYRWESKVLVICFLAFSHHRLGTIT